MRRKEVTMVYKDGFEEDGTLEHLRINWNPKNPCYKFSWGTQQIVELTSYNQLTNTWYFVIFKNIG